MASTKDDILNVLLTPLSWIYGGVTGLRNKLFDWGILTQEEFNVPVIGVGNLTVGGTGKTPHVEYIISRLAADFKIAVLSRGYKRRTKGFVLANANSTPETIGDEPYQIYRKFGASIKVAVCESRKKGINMLLDECPDINLIILDDSFQHRYVKPKVSILLTDFNYPVYNDHLLPLGRLRESYYSIGRADMVIVTKCPDDLQPINMRLINNEFGLMSFQKLYFSKIEYGSVAPVFPDDNPYEVHLSAFTKKDSVLLLTGIANPRSLVKRLRMYSFRIRIAHYPDHHNFSRSDIKDIEERFKKLSGEHKIIITTEKDAVRLSNNPYFPQHLKKFVYYIPIHVKMLQNLNSSDFVADLKKLIFQK